MSASKPEGCENCTKPATIHLTQIVGSKIIKLDLCEGCPKAQNIQQPDQFGLVEQLAGQFAKTKTSGSNLTCGSCGFTESQFQKIGRFGCPDCYSAFNEAVGRILPDLHKDTHHIGKFPDGHEIIIVKRQLQDLEQELGQAIEVENYEQASILRDQIQEIKTQL